MNLFQFAIHYRRLILFGFSLTFFSNFGQTFLVALFVPGFLETFGISNAFFGTVYSLATLASAFTLVWVGAKIDHFPLKAYALMVAGGLALAALILALSFWIWILFLGIYGLRLFGQGLSTHAAQTTMSRYFITMRGKALSLTSLGITAGEAILPITMTAVIAAFGWRAGWVGISLFIAVVLPAIIIIALRKDPAHYGEVRYRDKAANGDIEPGSNWRRSKVLRDPRFFLFLPGVVISPFLITGLFLYQTQLAGYKGWEIEILASAFIAFALAKSSFSLIAGTLVDRFTACRLFPFFLLPLMSGLLLLSLSDHFLIPFAYLFLAGITEGFGMNVKTAIYAELYGTANLGAIRSMMTMFMVISSAVSPILFGYLIDTGITFGLIIQGALGLMLVTIIPGAFLFREAKHESTLKRAIY